MLTALLFSELLPSVEAAVFSSSSVEGGSHDLTIERRFATAMLALLKKTSTAFDDSGIDY